MPPGALLHLCVAVFCLVLGMVTSRLVFHLAPAMLENYTERWHAHCCYRSVSDQSLQLQLTPQRSCHGQKTELEAEVRIVMLQALLGLKAPRHRWCQNAPIFLYQTESKPEHHLKNGGGV